MSLQRRTENTRGRLEKLERKIMNHEYSIIALWNKVLGLCVCALCVCVCVSCFIEHE